MAGGPNDFYVSFGSDAATFGKRLSEDLASARTEIKAFNTDLANLGKGEAGSALSRLLHTLAQARGAIPPAGHPGTPPPTAGGGPAVGVDFSEMARDAASMHAETQALLGSITRAFTGVERLIGKVNEAERHINYSQGSIEGGKKKYRDPKTGQTTTADNPNAVPFISEKAKGGKPGAGGGVVTIAGTPKVMVDDAAFKRVVTAVEKQTSASKDIRKSVDKLYDLIKENSDKAGQRNADKEEGGGKKEGGGQHKATKEEKDAQADAKALAKRTAQQQAKNLRNAPVEVIRKERDEGAATLRTAIAQANELIGKVRAANPQDPKIAAMEAAVAETAKVLAKLEKPLGREKKAANRAKADEERANAPAPLSAQSRADKRNDIALAGDEEALRARVKNRDITNKDLQRIAGTFTEQGYPVKANSKSRNPQLLEGILAARKAYDEAGRVTAENLSGGGKKVATEVSKGVRNLVKQIVKAAELSAQEDFAEGILEVNRATGGTSSALQGRNGSARTPNHPIRGGAFGGRGDDLVGMAEDLLARRTKLLPGDDPRDPKNARVTKENIDSARRVLARRPNFNPYDPELREGVKGGGPEAVAARKALAGITRGLEAIDAAFNSKQYTGTKDKNGRPDWEGLASPKIQAGIQLRSQARQAFQDAQEAKDAKRRLRSETQAGIRGSAIDSFFGGGTVLGSGRQNASLAKLFPGLNVTKEGNLRPADPTTQRELYSLRQRQELQGREGPINEPDARPFSPTEVQRVQRAFNKYVKAFRSMAELGNDAAPEQMAEAKRKMAASMHQFIEQYEHAAHDTLRTGTETHRNELGYDPALGYGRDETYRTYGLSHQRSAVDEDRRIDAAARAAAKKAGPDPDTLKMVAANARKFQQRVAAVKDDKGIYRDPSGEAVDLKTTVGTARKRAQDIVEGKAVPSTMNLPQLRREFEAMTHAMRLQLEKELQRGQRGIERHTLSGNADKLAEYTKIRDTARAGLDSINPVVRDPKAEAARARYEARVAEQKRITDEAARKYQEVRHEHLSGSRQVSDAEGKKVLQDAIYQDYMLSQMKPPASARGRQVTSDQQLAALQQAAKNYASLTRGAYDTARGKPPTPPKPPGADGEGAGGGGGRGPGVLQKILTEVMAIHAIMRTGIKVTHTGPGAKAAAEKAAGTSTAGTSTPKPAASGPMPTAAQARQTRDEAKAEAQKALLQAHGGYDPNLGYGTMESQQKKAEKATRAAAAASEKAARVDRDRQLSMRSLYDTTGRVSQSTVDEVLKLERYIRSGETSTRVTEQMVIAYRALNNELAKANIPYAERQQRISTAFGAVGAPNKGSDLKAVRQAANLTEGNEGTQGAKGAGEQMGGAMAEGARTSFQTALFGSRGFYSRVWNSFGTFIVRNASAGLVFGMTNALQEAVGQAVETESTFVRVSEALDKTGRSSSGLRTQLSGLSQEYGVALKDVYTTTAGLTGLFDQSDVGNKQLVGLTRVAVQLELISGGALNATEAMRSLSSITSAYGDESVKHIADVATAIQNNLGVNIEETIEGVARLSGQTKVMGIDFEHAATYVAAISKLTNQTGAGAGEQFSRILESFQHGKTQTVVTRALKNIPGGNAIDVRGAFEARDYQSAIDALLSRYKLLSKAEQARVSTQIGGARQAASINALLSQGAKVLDVVTAAQNSNGAAEERAAEISKQLAAEMKRAHQGFVNFIAALERSGALNAVVLAFGALLKVLELVNSGLGHLNDFVDQSTILSQFRQWGGAIAGLALGFVLARKAAAGFMAVLAAGGVGRVVAGTAGVGAAGAGAGAAEGGAVAGAGAAEVAGGAGLMGLFFGRRGGRTPKLPHDYRLPGYGPGAVPLSREAAAVEREARYGALNAAGVPATMTQRLYGKQASRLTGLSERAAARSASLAAAADTRLYGGYGPSYASNVERSTGLGTRAIGRVEQGVAGGLGAVSTGAEKTSNGLARMARNTALASGAVFGIIGAAVLLTEGFMSFHATTKEYNSAFKNAFNPDKPADNSDAGKAKTAFDTVLKHNRDQNKGFSGLSRAFAHTITNPGALAQAVFNPFSSGGALGRQSDRDQGVLSDKDWSKYIDKPDTPLFRRLGASMGNLKKVQAAIKKNEEEIQKDADKINASGLSTAQKATALSELEDIHKKLQASGQRMLLAAEGVNKLNTLTQDQLDAMGPLVQSLVGFGSDITKNYGGLLTQYINTLGIDPGSDYAPKLAELAAGGFNKTTVKQIANPAAAKLPNAAQQIDNGSRRPVFASSPQASTKFQPLSVDQRQNLGEQVIRGALTATQAKVQSLPDGEEKTALITTAIQLAGQLDQMVQTRLQRMAADASALIDHDRLSGNYSGAASAAAQAIAAADATYKAGSITKAQRDDQVAQIQATAAQDRVVAATHGLEMAKSSTRNSIQQASLELQIANTTLATLRANGGSAADIQNAGIRANQAVLALQDQQAEYQLAALTTRLAKNRKPGDAIGVARDRLAIALATQRDAERRFTTHSTQYQQATQGVIDAQYGITAAIADLADANSNLAISFANAAGNTVKAAKLQLQAAQRKLREAIRHSGGTNTSESKTAQAAVVSAQAAYRDAQFQASLDTINFNQQMGYASAAATISQLQQLLKMKNLTTAERRQVLLQIHQLQQSLVSDLTSSGFNIPNLGNVKLPTPYEVRRSLGVDKLQQSMKDAVDVQNGGFSLTTPVGQSGNTELIGAVRAVTAAVTAKGAQYVAVDQKNTFTVPSAAVAKQIATQVIDIINKQTGQQSRATSTTPRTVPTK